MSAQFSIYKINSEEVRRVDNLTETNNASQNTSSVINSLIKKIIDPIKSRVSAQYDRVEYNGISGVFLRRFINRLGQKWLMRSYRTINMLSRMKIIVSPKLTRGKMIAMQTPQLMFLKIQMFLMFCFIPTKRMCMPLREDMAATISVDSLRKILAYICFLS